MRVTRRSLLTTAMAGSAAVVGGQLLTTAAAQAADTSTTTTSPASTTSRVDVHHHYCPPEYVPQPAGSYLPFKWSLQQTLDDMTAGSVDAVVLSTTPPVLAGLALQQGLSDMYAPSIIRRSNEYGAQLVADHPDRFGLFAALPMTHADDALQEIAYAFDTLHADGIVLFTNYGTQWLGDSVFDPVFAELDRRRAVIHVHPAVPTCCFSPHPTQYVTNVTLIEFQTDTSRAIVNLIFGGASQRFPNVRMIFSHGGGTVPYLYRRFPTVAASDPVVGQVLAGTSFGAEFGRFYYDTAQVAAKPQLLALNEVLIEALGPTAAPSSRLLFGTDFPYLGSQVQASGLSAAGVFTSDELSDIDTNALSLLPRLATLVSP